VTSANQNNIAIEFRTAWQPSIPYVKTEDISSAVCGEQSRHSAAKADATRAAETVSMTNSTGRDGRGSNKTEKLLCLNID